MQRAALKLGKPAAAFAVISLAYSWTEPWVLLCFSVCMSAHFSRNRLDASPTMARAVWGHHGQNLEPPYCSKGEELAILMKVGVKIVYFPQTSDKRLQQNNWRKDLTGTEILAGCQNEECVFEDTVLVVVPSGLFMFNIHVSVRWHRNSVNGHKSEYFQSLQKS